MASTTVIRCYGFINLLFACEACGKADVYKFPRRAAGSGIGIATNVASDRAKKQAKSLIRKDQELVETMNPIEFFNSCEVRAKPCRACGFVQKWQRKKYRKQYPMEYGVSVAMIGLLLGPAVGVSATMLFGASVIVGLTLGAIIVVATLMLGLVVQFITGPQMVEARLKQIDLAAGHTERRRPELEFKRI